MNVHSFPLGEKIVGLALIDQQLYLLRERSCEEIDVYSTADHRLLRRINISDLNRDSSVTWPRTHGYVDIASCPVEKCLYLTFESKIKSGVTDVYSATIQRIDLPGNMTQSNISDFTPCGISVAQNSNLLVSGNRQGPEKYQWDRSAIVEWDWKESKLIREIRLALKCRYFMCHHLHLSNYHAVVYNGNGHEVGLVDTRQGDTGDSGLSFYRSYGSVHGRGVGKLDHPCHIAVDQDTGCIFVADSGNRRVVLLSRSLLFIRNITDGFTGHKVNQVCFDSGTRRLYVGMYSDEGGVVKVLSFHVDPHKE